MLKKPPSAAAARTTTKAASGRTAWTDSRKEEATLRRTVAGSPEAIAAARSRTSPKRNAFSTALDRPVADIASATSPKPATPRPPSMYQVANRPRTRVAPSRR